MASITPKDKPYIGKGGRQSWRVKWREGGGRDGADDSETVYTHEVAKNFAELIEGNGHRRPAGYPKGCHGLKTTTHTDQEPGSGKKGKKKEKKLKKKNRTAKEPAHAERHPTAYTVASSSPPPRPRVTAAITARIPTFREAALDNILGPEETDANGLTSRNWDKRGMNRRSRFSRETAHEYVNMLEMHVFGVIGDMPLNAITYNVLDSLVRAIAATPKAAPVRKPMTRLATVRAWAVERGIPVSAVGLVKADVVAQWEAAGSPSMEPLAEPQRISLSRIDNIIGGAVKPVFAAASRVGPDGEAPLLLPGMNPCDKYALPEDVVRTAPAKREREIVDAEDFRIYLRALSMVWVVAVRLFVVALHTGLRWGELTGLRVCDIDFKANTLRVNQVLAWKLDPATGKHHLVLRPWAKTEGSTGRRVPFTAGVAEVLTEQCKGKRPEDLVFTSKKGRFLNHSNFCRDVLSKAEEIAMGMGFTQHVTPHMLRHTILTGLRDSDVPTDTIEDFGGHVKGSAAARGYRHVTDAALERLRDAMGPLEDLVRIAMPSPAPWPVTQTSLSVRPRDEVLFRDAVPA